MFLTVGIFGRRKKENRVPSQKEGQSISNNTESRVVASGEVVVVDSDIQLKANLQQGEIAVTFFAIRNTHRDGDERRSLVMFHCPYISQSRLHEPDWRNLLAKATQELLGYSVTNVQINIFGTDEKIKQQRYEIIKGKTLDGDNKEIMSGTVKFHLINDNIITAQATVIPQSQEIVRSSELSKSFKLAT